MTTDDQQGSGREYHPTTREARLAQKIEQILYSQGMGNELVVQWVPRVALELTALIDAEIAAAVEEERAKIRKWAEGKERHGTITVDEDYVVINSPEKARFWEGKTAGYNKCLADLIAYIDDEQQIGCEHHEQEGNKDGN